MNTDTQSPPPYYADVERQREAFFRDIARMPVHAVEGMVNSVNFLSPAERDGIISRRDELAQQRAARVEAFLEQESESLNERAGRASEELTDVVGQVNALIADIENGVVDLPTAERRFQQLGGRLDRAERVASGFESAVESIREKEENPEAWLQSLEKRFPAIKEGIYGPTGWRPNSDTGATDWTRRDT